MDEEKLKERKREILKYVPLLGEVLRGSFRKVYSECIRKNCRCHKGKRYRHGPYYRISYGRGEKIYTVYVGLSKIGKAKRWTDNYNKIWKAIERISEVNIKILRLKDGKRK